MPRRVAPPLLELRDLLGDNGVYARSVPNQAVPLTDESGLSNDFLLVTDPRMLWETAHLPRAGPAPLLLAALDQATRRADAEGRRAIPVGAVPTVPTPRSGIPERWVVALHLADLVRVLARAGIAG